MIGGPPQTYVANGQLIRDARLDRYLAAHQQFAGSSVLGVPSVFVRNATADAADR
jgi:sigma-E factor negative regulatory protein RseA